jgi:integrase
MTALQRWTYQAALSVAYGAGLRASEVIALKVTDVDSERMTQRVEQGKGRKGRYAMLSPVLLERLAARMVAGGSCMSWPTQSYAHRSNAPPSRHPSPQTRRRGSHRARTGPNR